MRVELFDYFLPEERIALRPLTPRDAARLLVVREDGSRAHHVMRDLPELLRARDALVVNDTKVIPARFFAHRQARDEQGVGASIEITLHKRVAPDCFLAFARPAKRLKPEDRLRLANGLEASVVARGEGGEAELRFNLAGAALDAAITVKGTMPLPHYIASRRVPDERDGQDYQTIFAAEAGSVAAPTAGLHFTPQLFARLDAKNIAHHSVTLNVGAGTFLPVMAKDTSEHKMHTERAMLSCETADALNEVRAHGGRIVAVGTTSLRTLETAADDQGSLQAFSGETSLFITPGYRFKCTDVLLTNFHLPRSTLFMLVCAFSGSDVMKAAYQEAIAQHYRFYSYGDACLLFKPTP
jgi:S-adenosylmethionine:tRNA ribosyltransferase-isomerase